MKNKYGRLIVDTSLTHTVIIKTTVNNQLFERRYSYFNINTDDAIRLFRKELAEYRYNNRNENKKYSKRLNK